MLPNILSVVIVQATLTFAGMIVVESGLSFLGFGISKSIPSWGNMLSDAQEGDVLSSKPWIWMPPALMITLTILSINFVGEGLKDAFNLKEENNKLIINKWYWSKLFQYHLYCNYLYVLIPLLFHFFNVLNEAFELFLYLYLEYHLGHQNYKSLHIFLGN